jgi:uncharacterized protein YdaU (DUF1376 family)
MDKPTRKQKPNWVLYDPSAYWADTAHLDAADHGIYKLLIDLYYITGKPLEGAPRELLRQCRLSPTRRNERKMKVILQSFFIQTDAKWTQSRCDFELAARANLIEKKRKAAEKRWNGDADASAVNMHPHDAEGMPYTYTVTYTEEEKKKATGPETTGPASDLKNKKSQTWEEAVNYLAANGIDEARARNMLSAWRKNHSDISVLSALNMAKHFAVSEPIPYIQKMIIGDKPTHTKPSSFFRHIAQRENETNE